MGNLPIVVESEQRYLGPNLMRFPRALRALGFAVGPEDVAAALRAVELVGVGSRDAVHVAIRSHFVRRADQVPVFDEAFRLLWRQAVGRPADEEVAHQTLGASVARLELHRRLQEAATLVPWYQGALAAAPRHQNGSEAGACDRRAEVVQFGGFSPVESLRRARLDALTPAERAQLQRLVERLRAQPLLTGRRAALSRKGTRWDLRASARRALRTGGELLELLHRRPRKRPRAVALLIDISGSMEAYSRPLLSTAHGLAGAWGSVEVFAFGTRLTRLTRQLARRQPDRALAEAARHVVDWSGGTRIGQSLHQFNRRWARQVLRRGAVVIIVSDGWDRGDLDLLRREMGRLARFARRVVWVNPLMARPGREALASGMQAALPFIDDLVGVASVDDLRRLAAWLVTLDERRPVRAQRASGRAG
ncbi:MAG: VWA domain-containing protein [Bacillota bacterium]